MWLVDCRDLELIRWISLRFNKKFYDHSRSVEHFFQGLLSLFCIAGDNPWIQLLWIRQFCFPMLRLNLWMWGEREDLVWTSKVSWRYVQLRRRFHQSLILWLAKWVSHWTWRWDVQLCLDSPLYSCSLLQDIFSLIIVYDATPPIREHLFKSTLDTSIDRI